MLSRTQPESTATPGGAESPRLLEQAPAGNTTGILPPSCQLSTFYSISNTLLKALTVAGSSERAASTSGGCTQHGGTEPLIGDGGTVMAVLDQVSGILLFWQLVVA